MSFLKSIKLTAIAVTATVAVGASAQSRGEVTFYSDIAFRGQTFTVTGARENVRLPFVVRSARVAPGESWEICTNTRYRGTCNVVDDTQGNVAWRVGSVRPLANQGLPPSNSASLRGMASEYFPQPSNGMGRVLACLRGSATAACAAQSADRFCETRGWTASSYERMETVMGRNYLSDVLCTRTR